MDDIRHYFEHSSEGPAPPSSPLAQYSEAQRQPFPSFPLPRHITPTTVPPTYVPPTGPSHKLEHGVLSPASSRFPNSYLGQSDTDATATQTEWETDDTINIYDYDDAREYRRIQRRLRREATEKGETPEGFRKRRNDGGWEGFETTFIDRIAAEDVLLGGLLAERDQDLSRNLLNLYWLKRHHRDGRENPHGIWASQNTDEAEEGDDGNGEEEDWEWIDSAFTEWPDHPLIVPRRGDEEKAIGQCFNTPRGPIHGEPWKPSQELETCLGDVVLRQAHKKWEGREDQYEYKSVSGADGEGSDAEGGYNMEEDLSDEEIERRRIVEEMMESGPNPVVEADTGIVPEALADDEIAKPILKAPVASVLSRLDDLLDVLKRYRKYQMEQLLEDKRREAKEKLTGVMENTSGTDTQAVSDTEGPTTDGFETDASTKSARGRPKVKRELTKSIGLIDFSEPEQPEKPKKSEGRPKKVHTPLPGETLSEMRRRVAREMHRPIPPSPEKGGMKPDVDMEEPEVPDEADVENEEGDGESVVETIETNQEKRRQTKRRRTFSAPPSDADDSDDSNEEGETESVSEAIEERRHQTKRPRTLSVQPSDADDSDDSEQELHAAWSERRARKCARSEAEKEQEGEVTEEENEEELAPREWSEVIGLAAMSGIFPPTVISRTVERCSQLFGEGLDLRVFHGVNETAVPYRPDAVLSFDGMESSDEDKSVAYEQVYDPIEEPDTEPEGEADERACDVEANSPRTSGKSSRTHSRKSSGNVSLPHTRVPSPEFNSEEDIDMRLSSSSEYDSEEDENEEYECPIGGHKKMRHRYITTRKAFMRHMIKKHDWCIERVWALLDMMRGEDEVDREEMLCGAHRDGFLMKVPRMDDEDDEVVEF